MDVVITVIEIEECFIISFGDKSAKHQIVVFLYKRLCCDIYKLTHADMIFEQ